MSILILCFAFMGQFRETGIETGLPPVPADVKEILFIEAQEEWVYENRKPYTLGEVLSSEEIALLKRLDCSHYHCREAVERDIKAMGNDAVKLLFWGQKTKGDHLKVTCKNIRDRLFSCRNAECFRPISIMQDSLACKECSGTGDYRYILKWDYINFVGWFPMVIERDFFEPVRQAVSAIDEKDEQFVNGIPEGVFARP